MSISGNLKTMELAELLQWLSQGHKSGTLVIDDGEVEKKIFFQQGKIISSASSDPKEYLGHFLVSHGYIDDSTLAKALEMQEVNKMLLGKILVTVGAISEDDLDRMLRLKAKESIFDIFSWAEGEFRFADGDLPQMTMVPLTLDVTGLVLEGIQRIDEWNEIRKYIPSGLAVPVCVGELNAPENRPGAKQILDLVNDDRTVEEIAIQTHSSEFFVAHVLYDQLQRHTLKVVRARTAGRQAAEGATLPVDANTLVRTSRKLLQDRDFEGALRHLRAARSLEPNNQNVGDAVTDAERRIKQSLEMGGVVMTAVPKLTHPPELITQLDLSPQEGFILSRINQRYDIDTIIKISPMPSLDALVVIWSLLQAGHVRLQHQPQG